MEYIIFDLEWSRYSRKIKLRCPDEIIQIGAVKYNENFECMGVFNRYIRPNLYKKLDPMVENMTGITMEKLLIEGVPFNRAIKEFRSFVGWERPVLMSWGIHDAVVLKNNCLYYNRDIKLDWMSRFADLQCAVSKKLCEKDKTHQLGLSHVADILGIEYAKEALHNALVDAVLTGKVFAKIGNEINLLPYEIDASKLSTGYKSIHITDLKNSLVNKRELMMRCPECGRFVKQKSAWMRKNKKFVAQHYCQHCKLDLVSSVEILLRINNDVHYKKRCRLKRLPNEARETEKVN